MMTGGRRSDKYGLMAEINMVPLIDVALVLLIIFMVMAPVLVNSRIKVTLPKAGAAEKETHKDDATRIQVQRDGAVFIDERPVAEAELAATLKRILPRPDQQSVVIEADKDVSFQHVVTVMAAARTLGISKLAVSVKSEEKHGAPRTR
jgi:biopolymer transport protein ExbD